MTVYCVFGFRTDTHRGGEELLGIFKNRENAVKFVNRSYENINSEDCYGVECREISTQD